MWTLQLNMTSISGDSIRIYVFALVTQVGGGPKKTSLCWFISLHIMYLHLNGFIWVYKTGPHCEFYGLNTFLLGPLRVHMIAAGAAMGDSPIRTDVMSPSPAAVLQAISKTSGFPRVLGGSSHLIIPQMVSS